jgi:hypothetical protein
VKKYLKLLMIIIIDLVVNGLYSLMGLFLLLLYGFSGSESDIIGINPYLRNIGIPILIIFQLIIGVFLNIHFYIKKTHTYKRKWIALVIINILIILVPYAAFLPDILL